MVAEESFQEKFKGKDGCFVKFDGFSYAWGDMWKWLRGKQTCQEKKAAQGWKEEASKAKGH